jgi:hypothetical protein
MENNNGNPNTGSKGVFPGSNQAAAPSVANVPGTQNQAQPVAKPVAQPVANYTETVAKAANSEDAKTYMRLETKNAEGQVSGVLEIDLISFRERGQESRYLSVNTVGAGQDGDQSDTTLSIDNEADFRRFKDFISDLNWND